MGVIGEILGTPLGYVMKLCYDLLKDYGLAIILFTAFTKVILFPVQLLVQKNSIKMIKMKPKLDALKYQYVDDKDALLDAEGALYKEEGYSPFMSVIPLLIQLPLIFGLIDVVYRPLKHILHFPQTAIDAFTALTSQLLNQPNLGSAPELAAMRCVQDSAFTDKFLDLQGQLAGLDVAAMVDQIKGVSMNFCGIDLSQVPRLAMEPLVLIPILAGVSALIMCIVQNKINVLQIEQNALSQWGMTIFMIAFSTYFAFLVPGGVGLYWIFGNLFSIPVMFLCNLIYTPKKYIDYDTLNLLKEKAKKDREVERRNNKLSHADYKRLCSGDNLQRMRLMFYSEASGFYKYFENIIEAILEKSDEDIWYVTSDPDDAIFQKNNPRIKPYYIAGNQLITLMMKLECKIVVMTTPDLEKYHIKRSKMKKNIEYIFTEHGVGGMNLCYRTGALDYFDTVFVVSRAEGIEIRETERLRHTKKKHIVKCGYGLLDNMIAAYEKMEKVEHDKPVILIAPSYQYDNILDSCIDDMLASLLNGKYRVIIRPHPQYIRRFPVEIENLINRYKDRFSEDFMIETDFSSNVTVYTADMVITDWSGIGFEFSFTTNKPTLYVNTQMKVVNKDWDKIKMMPYDITGRDIVGRSISKEETRNIAAVVDDLLAHQADYYEQIDREKHEFLYNLGHSGEVGADYILSRLNGRPLAEGKEQEDAQGTAPAAEGKA